MKGALAWPDDDSGVDFRLGSADNYKKLPRRDATRIGRSEAMRDAIEKARGRLERRRQEEYAKTILNGIMWQRLINVQAEAAAEAAPEGRHRTDALADVANVGLAGFGAPLAE